MVRLVRLVSEIGEQAMRSALKKTVPDEADAVIVVSTVHKAKGREWGRVRIADDFSVERIEKGGEEEIRLFYVALTRAKEAGGVPRDLIKYFKLAS